MGVLVGSGGTSVLVDALFDKPNPDYRGPAPETLEKIIQGIPPYDGVKLALVTHGHPDHFSPSVALRFLKAQSGAILAAPADAVADLRSAGSDWPRIAPRVIPLDLKIGEVKRLSAAGIPVTAVRTLHSGDRDTPANVMVLFEINGRRIFHEGDSTGKPEVFRGFGLGEAPLDLAIVHYWFPLEPSISKFFQDVVRPEHIALGHLPIAREGDFPGKIDMVRKSFKDLFLLLPGMPGKAFPVAEIFAPGVVSREGIQAKLTMSADGSEILYSERNPETKAVTFLSRHRQGDSWGDAIALPYGREYMEIEPSLSPDGRKILFVSDRPPDGSGQPGRAPDIWMAEKAGDRWGLPVRLGPPILTDDPADIEAHPFFDADGGIYFMRQNGKSRRLFHAERRGSGFVEPRPLPLKEDLFAGQFSGPCLSADGRILVMHSRKSGGFGSWDLYVSFQDESGIWSELRNLGPAVNTAGEESSPTFSPDGRDLFFTRDGDIYRVGARIVESVRGAKAEA
jgi:hypothetical protein